jgi:putative peptidoglycan lipid II flippase
MVRSSVLVSLLAGAVSAFSFVNQLVIARTFGATPEMDAYLIGISVPTLVLGLMAGVLAYSVVPMQVRRKTLDPEGYPEFAGLVLFAFAALALTFSLVGYLITPAIVRTTAPQLDGELFLQAVAIARISWMTVGLSILFGYLVAIQNAAKRFLMPALAIWFPYAGMMTMTLLFSPQLRATALAWGMLIGYIVALPALYVGAASELKFSVDLLRRWKDLGPIFGRMPFGMASALCFTVFGTIDAIVAARLESGSVSYLGYAQRLLIAVGNLVLLGPWTVVPPYLAEQFAAGRHDKFREVLSRALAITIFIASPLALILGSLRIPAIELLFERGAFSHRATLGVAGILPGMLVGMLAMICVTLLIKAMHAKDDVNGAAIVGVTGAILYFILGSSLSRALGISGIVGAYALTWWLLLVLCSWRVWGSNLLREHISSRLSFFTKFVGTLITVAIFLAITKSLLIRPLADVGRLSLVIRLGTTVAVSGLSFVVAALVLFRIRSRSDISAFLLVPKTDGSQR